MSAPWSNSALAASASLPVDAHHHFGDREGNDVAGNARLRFLGGDLAEHIAAFIETRIVDAEIVTGLVAGSVLEHHLGKLLGDLHFGVHEAKRRAEDDLAAFACQALEGAVGIGAFGDVLQIGGLDLVAERLLDLEPALVVLVGVAEIADRAGIDPAGLQLVGSLCGRGQRQCRCRRHQGNKQFFHCVTSLC